MSLETPNTNKGLLEFAIGLGVLALSAYVIAWGWKKGMKA